MPFRKRQGEEGVVWSGYALSGTYMRYVSL
jgi:hypothetical protein